MKMRETAFSEEDIRFMHLALKLGEKGLGLTEPNPMVGAVVVSGGKIIATGCHRRYGEAHAERSALEKTGESGTTLYVSLEPCAHTGHTPPCTDIIIEKKVSRVVIPYSDPNPRVNGKGLKILEDAGIRVDSGLLEDEARYINRHYLKYITTGIPWVTINAGVTVDGKLSDDRRNSQWITGEVSRSLSHSFRGEFSAIIAGSATVEDDDPMLTIREEGWDGKRFTRVVLDTKNRLSTDLKIFNMGDEWPLFVFSGIGYETAGGKNGTHFFVGPGTGGLDLCQVLSTLGTHGLASVLVEGGGTLINSFLKAELADEIVLFTAAKILGGKNGVEIMPDGVPLEDPVRIRQSRIIKINDGYIVRGLI